MARILQIQCQCPVCNQPRLFTKPGVNHLIHAVVSLFLCGLWIPIWILAALINGLQAYRCVQCGSAADAGVRKGLVAVGIVLLFFWGIATYNVATSVATRRSAPAPSAAPPASTESPTAEPASVPVQPQAESGAAKAASEKKKSAADLATFRFHQDHATAGSASSMYRLAQLYLSGIGCEKDTNAATGWLKAAADAGHPEAPALLSQLARATNAPPAP